MSLNRLQRKGNLVLHQATHLPKALQPVKTDTIPDPIRDLQIESLHAFLKGAWESVIAPGRDLDDNWHLQLLAEHLELVAEGETRKLLINIAPRSLKSVLTTICFPCWQWLHDPKKRFLCLSYESTLANSHNDERRNIIISDFYQQLYQRKWGESLTLSKTKNRISEFVNHHRGAMLSRGLTGSVTGAGGDCLIVDDGNNPADDSDVTRLAAEKNFRDYSFGRRNNAKTSALIVIQQRVHCDDISGVIEKDLNKDGSWTVVKLPTRYNGQEPLSIHSPKNPEKLIHTRQPGSLMHPSRHGEAEDAEAKISLGQAYASRHDQRPIAEGGGIFPDNFRYFSLDELPKQRHLALSIDASFGEVHAKASYVVVQVWAIARPNFYLIDNHREKMTFDRTLQVICETRLRWHDYFQCFIPTTLVEKKANGRVIIDRLQEKWSGTIAINPTESKKARAEAVAPTYRSGNVALNDNATWTTDYELELANFPLYGSDDQVDASSQLISYFLNRWRLEEQADEFVSSTYNKATWY